MKKQCYNNQVVVEDLQSNETIILNDPEEVADVYNLGAGSVRAYLNNHMQFKKTPIKIYWLTEYALVQENKAFRGIHKSNNERSSD